ncbi:hypothetical protein PG993_011796, partial [Apiospora rasikravindrae]
MPSSIPQATLARPDVGPPWETAVIIREIKVSLPGPLNSSPTGKFTPPTAPRAASPFDTPPRYSSDSDLEDLKCDTTTSPREQSEHTLQAWLQVFASFLLLVNGYGYYSSFGAFQSHWQTTLQRSPADISWTGSLQLSLPFVGAVSGRLMDQGYFRSLLVTGCLLQLVGILVTSFVERPGQFAQLLLAQGNGTGVWQRDPLHALRDVGVALLQALSGVRAGGCVFWCAGRRCDLHDGELNCVSPSFIARELSLKIGHPWTIRVMGFVVLFNCAVILAIAKPKAIEKPVSAPWFDLESWKDAIYVLFAVGIFFCRLGSQLCFFLQPSESLLLLLVMNAVGVPGRLAPALLADLYWGSFNLLIPFAVGVGTALLGWMGVYSEPSYICFVVLYGVCANAVQTLLPSALAGLTADPAKMGVRTGMAFTVLSVACLSGPPIAGALIALDGGAVP